MKKPKMDLPAKKDIKTYSLISRKSKIGLKNFGKTYSPDQPFSDFLASFPDVLAAGEFKRLVGIMAQAKNTDSPLIWAMGAHVIKVGLNPLLIDLMDKGWISAISMNGAGIIHDFELAFAGKTSEDVDKSLENGSFGMAAETGEHLNKAIISGAEKELGLGECIGRLINDSQYPHKDLSLLGRALTYGIPVFVHVAVGTDIIHVHPSVSGEAVGKTSLKDFQGLCSLIRSLGEGGVFLNIGSAVILPEVFLKGLSFARNTGAKVDRFTTAVFDFNHHYRPYQNIVKRPAGEKTRGYYFIGHHEIMIPLLAAALKEQDRSSSD